MRSGSKRQAAQEISTPKKKQSPPKKCLTVWASLTIHQSESIIKPQESCWGEQLFRKSPHDGCLWLFAFVKRIFNDFLEIWLASLGSDQTIHYLSICRVPVEYRSTHALVRAHGAEEPDADDDTWVSGPQHRYEILHQTICHQNWHQGEQGYFCISK